MQRMEGLSPSDAIMFPLLAGCTLAGLYFLIKWMNDPELLNRILNAYFAFFAVFSVSGLVTGSLDYLHSMVFPRRYADEGVMWHVHEKAKQATALTTSSASLAPRLSPLPGSFSRLPLPSFILSGLWWLRALPGQKWTVKIHLHKVGALKARIGSHGIIGAIVSVSTVVYFNFVSKPWFLTNLMGFGFSYNALQLMSPTTFTTGSLILGSLFLYDIYFVFYT
jgi:minor histocompatibility antigen H13